LNHKWNRYLGYEEGARLFEHLPESFKPLVTAALHPGCATEVAGPPVGWRGLLTLGMV